MVGRMAFQLTPKAGWKLPVSPAFVRHEVFVQGSISEASLVIVKDFLVAVAERCFPMAGKSELCHFLAWTGTCR